MSRPLDLTTAATAEELVCAAHVRLASGDPVAVEASALATLTRTFGVSRGRTRVIELLPRTPAEWPFRLRDILFGGAALVLAAPIIAVLAALVRLTSPGPAFHATTVVGQDGRPFVWRKLRSMRLGTADEERDRRTRFAVFMRHADKPPASLGQSKILDAARLTRVGAFIRRHSIDELPQLWNVVRGDMTLVGPRPCLPYEYEMLSDWQRLRYRARPGLTGPSQVYARGRAPFNEIVAIDYCYSWRRSFWLDTRLLMRTLAVVVSGAGGR